jgi:hypothetical protein
MASVGATLVAAPAVLAAHAGTPHTPPPASSTTPRAPAPVGGQIYLDGAGTVRVTGSFLAFGDVGGMDVTVIDRRGDARVILGGQRMGMPRRATVRSKPRARVISFRPSAEQRVTIEGRNVSALFRGNGNVTLSITGSGKVRLDGVGTFRVNSQPPEAWPLQPITLPLRQTPRTVRG